ncbi:ABC transporter substrate-binding protein (plasmid) [Moraxella sp. K23]
MSKSMNLLSVAIVLSSLNLVACSKPAAEQATTDKPAEQKTEQKTEQGSNKPLKPFRFLTDWFAEAEHGGFYQAQADNLYKEKGLDVTIGMGGPQINNYQLLAANKAECIIGYDLSTLNAISQGMKIREVAASFQKTPNVLIAHDDVKSIDQIKGKTLLVSSAQMTEWYPWLKAKYNLNDNAVKPYTFSIQPFMNDKNIVQQGYISSEPYAIQQAGAKPNVFLLSDYGYPAYGAVIVCRQDVIDSRPDDVKAFLEATMQGWKNYFKDGTKANQTIFKLNPQMTQGQIDYGVEQMKKNGFVFGGDAATKGIGTISEQRMNDIWQMATSLKLVDGTKAPKDSFYTTKFIDQVKVLP